MFTDKLPISKARQARKDEAKKLSEKLIEKLSSRSVDDILKCTTLHYLGTLRVACTSLKEIIQILGPIRADSEEGAIGLKVSGAGRVGSGWLAPERRVIFLAFSTSPHGACLG